MIGGRSRANPSLLSPRGTEEEPIAGLPWAAVVVNKVAAEVGATRATAASAGAARATAAATARAAGGTVGGGEELRTLGQKACPPRDFTMVGLEEERRWRGEFQTGNGDLK